MTDVPQPPEPALESQSGASLLSAISREMVKAMKTYYGRGPTKAKSYLMDDLLFIVMREGITQAEETMLSAGKEDEVQAFRRQFEKIMAERLVGTIEQLTDRKVVAYQSQVLFDPAHGRPGLRLRQTARAAGDRGDRAGAVHPRRRCCKRRRPGDGARVVTPHDQRHAADLIGR